jgi:uncharacterized protein with HEPN domain
MKEAVIYLEHILEAIDRITKYTDAGREAFYKDTKTQDATFRNFQTIGDAARTLSEFFPNLMTDIVWGDVIGFRNVIVHDYLGLDLPTVWSIIVEELQPLRAKVQATIDSLSAK